MESRNYRRWLDMRSGYPTAIRRSDQGIRHIQSNLDKGGTGKVTEDVRQQTLSHLHGTTDLSSSRTQTIIEAIPEQLDLKIELFQQPKPSRLKAAFEPIRRVYPFNPSRHPKDPGRVIGRTFSTLYTSWLLELIIAETTRSDVVDATTEYGRVIGKEVIHVKDVPGFATSRLGVALGMEAIRMVEQGVASPEDIDKAMVLGYRHPVGPLKLTDMVGLDVRMHIGEYLADALNNEAFRPPALMRDMVKRGDLGKKSGQGFYTWT